MADEFDWDAPPLAGDDQKLIDAYRAVGMPLDQLPYTDEFERMIVILGLPATNETRRYTLKRLMTLRKMGRLPRVGRVPDETPQLF